MQVTINEFQELRGLVQSLRDEMDELRSRVDPVEAQPLLLSGSKDMAQVEMGTVTHANPLKEDSEDDHADTPQEEEEEKEGEVCLDESIWDAALLIGLPGSNVAPNILGSLMLLLNVVIQVGLAIIIWLAFANLDYTEDTIQGYRKWRRNIAHGEDRAVSVINH